MMNVNIELPAPIAKAPTAGTVIYVPNPGVNEVKNVPHVESWEWEADCPLQERLLGAGQIHLDAGSAYLHAVAHITLSGGEV